MVIAILTINYIYIAHYLLFCKDPAPLKAWLLDWTSVARMDEKGQAKIRQVELVQLALFGLMCLWSWAWENLVLGRLYKSVYAYLALIFGGVTTHTISSIPCYFLAFL